MNEKDMEFHCTKCGLCCIGLDKKEITAGLQDGDGICRHLDQTTMCCMIYEDRPIFCRVDDYYNQFLADKMDREEYLALTYEACELKKREWEACGRDVRKVGKAVPKMTEKSEKIIAESLLHS